MPQRQSGSAALSASMASFLPMWLHFLVVPIIIAGGLGWATSRAFTSEDIGLADATALGVAIAAASAVEHVGLPEARYNLAHAVMHLARAPKSRGVVDAIDAAQAALLGGASIEVPQHLRDGSSPHDSVIPPRRYD